MFPYRSSQLGFAASWFLAPATLLQRSRTLQLLLPGVCNAPATLLDAAVALCSAPATHQRRSWTLLLPGHRGASATLLRRSQMLLLPSHCYASSTFLDAAAAVFWPLQRSCDAPGRCNSTSHEAATAASGPTAAPATLQDAVAPASGPTARSCNGPGGCNCAATLASGTTE